MTSDLSFRPLCHPPFDFYSVRPLVIDLFPFVFFILGACLHFGGLTLEALSHFRLDIIEVFISLNSISLESIGTLPSKFLILRQSMVPLTSFIQLERPASIAMISALGSSAHFAFGVTYRLFHHQVFSVYVNRVNYLWACLRRPPPPMRFEGLRNMPSGSHVVIPVSIQNRLCALPLILPLLRIPQSPPFVSQPLCDSPDLDFLSFPG